MEISAANASAVSVGYTVDKSTAARIKEETSEAAESRTGMPSEEFLEQQAAIFERPEVKAFLSRNSIETSGKLDTVGMRLFRSFRIKNGCDDLNGNADSISSKNSSEQADFYKKAYAEIYDEIEKGYADGTRSRTVIDDDGSKRLLTKEEEFDALDKEYENIINGLTAKRSREVDKGLIAAGKKEAPLKPNQKYETMRAAYESTQPKKQISSDVDEFVRTVSSESSEELESKSSEFIGKLSKNMLDFSEFFKQQYSLAEPGTFDITEFLASVSQKQ